MSTARQPLASQADIDAFIDAVWLEDGLSANTLAAYRRDLTGFARWLEDPDAYARELADRHGEPARAQPLPAGPA
uniref:site-specific integrase n=1 Tax=Achromobacter sp. UBA5777 TaxID=1945913 RepID=UPI0025C505ED